MKIVSITHHTGSRRPSKPCGFILISLCLGVWHAFESTCFGAAIVERSHGKSPAAILKNYLASDRESGEVVYYSKYLGQTNISIPGGKTVHFSAETTAFHGKWQPGAYYFMQLEKTNKVLSPIRPEVRSLVGKSDNKGWVHEGGYLRRYEEESGPVTAKNSQSQQHWATSKLFHVLGLGVLHVPGSLKWNENRFSAKRLDGSDVEGELILSDLGVPDQLLLLPSAKGGRRSIKLLYASANPVGLPNGFRDSGINPDGSLLPFLEIQFLSLSTTNGIVPESHFRPETVLASMDAAQKAETDSVPKMWRTVVHSNDHLYSVRSNRMVLMQAGSSYARRSGIFIITALAAVLFIFTLFYWRSKKPNQHN